MRRWPPRDEHPALVAFEPDAVLMDLLVRRDQPDPVGVGVLDMEIPVHVPEPVLGELRPALDLDGTGEFGPHAPWAISRWWLPQPVIIPAP